MTPLNRLLPVIAAVILAATALLGAAPKFTSVWKSPDAGSITFAGKKIAALVMTQDHNLRVAGEETLVSELKARSLESVATYRIAPKEELEAPDRAKVWFEKSDVEGVVVMRPVSKDKRSTYHPGLWAGPYYGSLWGYYGYGWSNSYIPGYYERDTVVVVETTIYSVSRNQLVWAALSETKNPKTLQKFVQDLVKECVKELHKQGLAKRIAK